MDLIMTFSYSLLLVFISNSPPVPPCSPVGPLFISITLFLLFPFDIFAPPQGLPFCFTNYTSPPSISIKAIFLLKHSYNQAFAVSVQCASPLSLCSQNGRKNVGIRVGQHHFPHYHLCTQVVSGGSFASLSFSFLLCEMG